MHQVALHRVILPVDDHHRFSHGAVNSHIEDGVVAGRGMEDLVDLLRIHGYGDRILSGAIDDRGHKTTDPQAAGFILAPGRARRGGDGDIFSHTDLWLKTISKETGWEVLAVYTKSPLTDVSSWMDRMAWASSGATDSV